MSEIPMSDIKNSFYTWLATQPAFVEVAVGVAFVAFAAPAVLAAVAMTLTGLEDWLAARMAMPAQAARASIARIAPYQLISVRELLAMAANAWLGRFKNDSFPKQGTT